MWLDSCYDGYIKAANTWTCHYSCDIGGYGNPVYSRLSYPIQSYCFSCSSACYECMGGGSN